jgi:2-keto-4-pentenoate hydratase/2-oxohepta-3-ene-1,7-dioic acid hydratase in catechol pathway
MPYGTPTVQIHHGGLLPISNIYCIGRNYAEHAAELNNPVPGEPVVFLKSSAALRPLADGPLAFEDETFHHEAELVLLIGLPVELGAKPGWPCVRALGLGIDLTRREVQSGLKTKGLPWTTAKSFAGSALVTDFLPLGDFPNPDEIRFTLKVNGEEKQRGITTDMLFKVPVILEHLARHNALLPGDLVFTGTPKGVGPLKRGDALELAFVEPEVRFRGKL